MDIKLKSFSRSIITKISASLLSALMAAALMGMFFYAARDGVNIEVLFEQDYLKSSQHRDEVSYPMIEALGEFERGKGAAITQEEFDRLFDSRMGLEYYLSNGEITYSNPRGKDKNYFFGKDFSYCIDKGNFFTGKNANSEIGLDYNMLYEYMKNDKSAAYVALSGDYISQQQREWDSAHNSAVRFSIYAVICAAILLVGMIWLIVVAGKKSGDEEIHLCPVDRIYTELILLAGCAATWFFILVLDELYFYYDSYFMVGVYGSAAFCAAWFAVILTMLLSLVRRLKSRTLIKQSLVYKILRAVFGFMKSFFSGMKFKKYRLNKRLLCLDGIFVAAELLLLFLVKEIYYYGAAELIIFAAMIAVAIFFLRGRNALFTDIGRLLDQIEKISEGELNYSSGISEASTLYDSAQQLSNIGSGLQKSLEKQIKDERMKIDLITNVSHDLKTPLTSIVGYIDLMEKEENLSPEMQDYVAILSKKADRLKCTVSDLFDLAKSTSGNAEIQMERLDFCKLVIQTLVDMEDKIQASGQIIKTELPETPVYISADGKKLYRVFQNIIENALKYSMPGTRIFVNLTTDNGRAYVTVKNTASYEMNFTADEITERFSRGDKARSTEGSGLGLSIAESFTQICGGRFYVVVDGDQFKTSVVFNLTE